MRELLRRCRGHLWWLAGLAAFFAAWFLLRSSRAAMNWLCGCVVLPLEQALGQLWSLTSVSVAEVLILSGVYVSLLYLAWQIRCLIACPERGLRLLRTALTAVNVILSVYAAFCLLWGAFYGADSFQDRAGLTVRGSTAAELTVLTRRFAGEVSALSGEVPRDENGCFAVSRADIFAAAMTSYDGVVEVFDCLSQPRVAPKAFVSSRAMSALDFTGFYFPFTGEANLNDESPAAYLPVTICHELAHQQGIASEQECNFVGILAAITSADAAYRYSGYLLGYVHLANALYRTDPDAWQTIRDSLPDTVRADLRQNSVYWARFHGPVNTAANKIYDGFLKSNGLQEGVQSYGAVVDLLLAYYGG